MGAVDPSGGSGAVNAPLPSDAPTGAGQESGTAANVNVPADPLQPQMVVGQGSDEVDQAAAAPAAEGEDPAAEGEMVAAPAAVGASGASGMPSGAEEQGDLPRRRAAKPTDKYQPPDVLKKKYPKRKKPKKPLSQKQMLAQSRADAGLPPKPAKTKKADADKKPVVGYMLFCKYYREAAKKRLPPGLESKATMPAISKILGDMWAKESPESKEDWKAGKILGGLLPPPPPPLPRVPAPPPGGGGLEGFPAPQPGGGGLGGF